MEKDKFLFPVSFQTDIVSYVLKDSGVFRKLMPYLSPTYFTEYQLREIVTISLDFFTQYEEVPNKTSMINEIDKLCVTGTHSFEDYQTCINTIYTFDFNKAYVRDNIVEFIRTQAIFKALKEAYTQMDNGTEVLKLIDDAVKIGKDLEFDGGYNYKERIKDRLNRLEKGIRTDNQIPISMIDLDRITSGGLGAGELGIVIGKAGDGKSIFLCNVAVGACMLGKKVVYFTMEACEDILAGRIDGAISNKTVEEMLLKKDKLEAAVSFLPGELIIKEFPTDITSPLDLSNFVSDMITNGFKPDLIIVDYIGIMAAVNKKITEPRHVISNICKSLITYLAKKFGVPLWSAHQASVVDDETGISRLNDRAKQDNQNKVMGIKDIAEAKVALAAEADLLITMNQNVEERMRSPQGLRIHVPKNRIGPKGGTFRYTIDKTRFIIKEAGAVNIPVYG